MGRLSKGCGSCHGSVGAKGGREASGRSLRGSLNLLLKFFDICLDLVELLIGYVVDDLLNVRLEKGEATT